MNGNRFTCIWTRFTKFNLIVIAIGSQVIGVFDNNANAVLPVMYTNYNNRKTGTT